MEKNHLVMRINYSVHDGKFRITGDINKRGQISVLETFLRGQIGAGVDNSKPHKKESYCISLAWYPENDDIVCTYDTKNKGLRDGILKDVLIRLRKRLRK
jgi:hypothetical protein